MIGRRVESCKEYLLIHIAQLGLESELADFILRFNQCACPIYARSRMSRPDSEWFGH